jgi:glycosyltransferase involved in cell wall biosynthesis
MKVSVIIPVFNAASYVHDAVSSVLAQPEVAEVILINDDSSDGSSAIAQEMQEKEERVRLFQNYSKVHGAGAARNIGIQQAGCEWIAFLDSDDFYLPGRFLYDAETIRLHQHCNAIYRGVVIRTTDMDAENILHGNYRSGYILRSGNPGEEVTLRDFLKGGGLHLNGLTMRRDAILRSGAFDESLIQGQDTDLIFRFLLKNKIYNTPGQEPGAVYRVHGSNTIRKTSEGIFYRRKAACKHLKLSVAHLLSPSVISKILRKYIEYDYLLLTGNKLNKYKALFKSLLLPILLFRCFIRIDTPAYTDR